MEFTIDYLKRWLSANRKRYFDRANLVGLIIVTFWFMGSIISPYLAPAGTINLGEDGVTGHVPSAEDNAAQIDNIDSAFARVFYDAGNGNCHQHASRSFFLNDNQMPFCARCTAIFFGIVIGVAILMFLAIELNILWLIVGMIPMGIDGTVQLLTDYESTNLLRFITGTTAGMVAGLAIGFIIAEIGNIVIQKRHLKKGP